MARSTHTVAVLELSQAAYDEVRTLAGLQWFVQVKGYKPGWASIKYKALFGDWPPRDLVVNAAPPTAELNHWIIKQQAIYSTAKRTQRRAQEAAHASAV